MSAPICPTCNGEGEIEDNGLFYYRLEPRMVKCPDCGGSGIVDETWGWTEEDFAAERADREFSGRGFDD